MVISIRSAGSKLATRGQPATRVFVDEHERGAGDYLWCNTQRFGYGLYEPRFASAQRADQSDCGSG
jgi:hypothetical protein